jgi:hypothetical protein
VELKSNYWFSDSLQPYILNPATGERTIYGSAVLLYLDEKQNIKLLSGDFYWQNDTLYKGGEPGITLKVGKWNFIDSGFVFTDTLLHKTFRLPGDSIGRTGKVFATRINESMFIYENDTLVPISNLSADLMTFMHRNWRDFR